MCTHAAQGFNVDTTLVGVLDITFLFTQNRKEKRVVHTAAWSVTLGRDVLPKQSPAPSLQHMLVLAKRSGTYYAHVLITYQWSCKHSNPCQLLGSLTRVLTMRHWNSCYNWCLPVHGLFARFMTARITCTISPPAMKPSDGHV